MGGTNCSALWSVAVLHAQQSSPQLFQKEKLANFHRAMLLLRVQVFFFLKINQSCQRALPYIGKLQTTTASHS